MCRLRIGEFFCVIFISFALHLSSCQDESVFHCSAKPGCQISQCDPIVPGFSLAKDIDRNEFPITCKLKNTQSGNNGFILSFIRGNTQEVEKLKILNQNLENELSELKETNGAIKTEMQELRNEMKALKQSAGGNSIKLINSPNPEPPINTNPSGRGNCDVAYLNKCFRVVIPAGAGFFSNFDHAQKLCVDNNWKLANIYDIVHYRLLEIYLRSKLPTWSTVGTFWTGMTYKNRQLRLTSGDEVNFLNELWAPNAPATKASQTKVAVGIIKDTREALQGIINTIPNDLAMGAICEN